MLVRCSVVSVDPVPISSYIWLLGLRWHPLSSCRRGRCTWSPYTWGLSTWGLPTCGPFNCGWSTCGPSTQSPYAWGLSSWSRSTCGPSNLWICKSDLLFHSVCLLTSWLWLIFSFSHFLKRKTQKTCKQCDWQLCSKNDLGAQRKNTLSVCQSSHKFKVMAQQGHGTERFILAGV